MHMERLLCPPGASQQDWGEIFWQNVLQWEGRAAVAFPVYRVEMPGSLLASETQRVLVVQTVRLQGAPNRNPASQRLRSSWRQALDGVSVVPG